MHDKIVRSYEDALKDSMQLTVKNLLEIPNLKIRLISNHKGMNRKIIWAHTSELANPSEWVQPDSLIMTTGLGIPKNGNEQKDYIQRLIDAELAALIISDNMSAPDDLSPLLEVANQHDFPVCYIDYHTPFSEVAKIVNDANKDKKDIINHQLNKLLYENTQALIKEHKINDLLVHIRTLLNMPIYLVDLTNPMEPLFTCDPIPSNILDRLSGLDPKSAEIQKIYKKSAVTLQIIPLKAVGLTLVIAANDIGHDLIQNLALLFSVYISSRKEHFYQKLTLSGELLDDIFNERVNESYIEKKLVSFRTNIERNYIVIAKPDKNIDYKDKLFKSSITGLAALAKHDRLILMIEKENLAKLTDLFPLVGASDPIKKITRICDALQEATLAYKNTSDEFPVQYYAEQNYSNQTLPKSIEEAQKIFSFNLDCLYVQDKAKKTRYIHTLKVFLENDRAWEKTSKILHIHKQTLVYRIQKIEEMTQRRLSSTADIGELWIALKAGEILGIIEE